MQSKLITIKYTPIVFLLLLCSCHAKKHVAVSPVATQEAYQSLAIQQDGKDPGIWGYIIFKHGKILIQQFSIPALQGNNHFATREEAALVGNLVAKKLNTAKHPGVTKKELDSLGITQSHNLTNEK